MAGGRVRASGAVLAEAGKASGGVAEGRDRRALRPGERRLRADAIAVRIPVAPEKDIRARCVLPGVDAAPLDARERNRYDVAMQTVYEAAGGHQGLLRLAAAWHARVLADEVVSHAFSHGYHPEHTERLAAYWAEALGGPPRFTGEYGDEASVVRMHSGNGPHEEMDRRAIACFDRALDDVGLASDARLRQVLHDYFAWATTTAMARYHRSADDVPADLRMPHWSWGGLFGTDRGNRG